uniref:Uncharacterized protein n=1 Tax=viral metagenome TaxID=1070528 RepID=A0A6M3LHI7_9ZZZZ
MRRLYVLMEVCKTDSCDVDGNAVYHPVDGGRGELMWLRTDRVIECADEGPCYRVPIKGDRAVNTDGIPLLPAMEDWANSEEEYFCFPAPELEEPAPVLRECQTCEYAVIISHEPPRCLNCYGKDDKPNWSSEVVE